MISESSQDEEEEVKAVTVKFARQETAEQKSRRMKSFDYLTKEQGKERWVPCTYQKIQVCLLQNFFTGSGLEDDKVVTMVMKCKAFV